MKIAYISNYRELSGYSSAARDYILAMDEVGLDILPRNINLTGNKLNKIPERLLELEYGHGPADVCILHTLPSFYEYCGNFKKTIGLFAWETSKLPSDWTRR